ncbi:hypothetical protein Pint_02233 [Pistacia integerrima]|uniref:Uncharacterized protein n=1 Tax=Pistacia integerrima TaxID=434235 RepID=A0ACC0ZE80_9ROSI|nr:hypothetical protein Pint_02233 [Pistacia integerrima]
MYDFRLLNKLLVAYCRKGLLEKAESALKKAFGRKKAVCHSMEWHTFVHHGVFRRSTALLVRSVSGQRTSSHRKEYSEAAKEARKEEAGQQQKKEKDRIEVSGVYGGADQSRDEEKMGSGSHLMLLCAPVHGRRYLAYEHSLNFNSSSPPLNWSSSIECCLSEVIKCDANGHVTHLWLPRRGLTATISPSIANLTHLTHLSRNIIDEAMPDDDHMIPRWNSEVLGLSGCRLCGQIPALAKKFTDIGSISNQLSGEIPASLRNLHFLSYFSVAESNLQGQVNYWVHRWNIVPPSSIKVKVSAAVKVQKTPLKDGAIKDVASFK